MSVRHYFLQLEAVVQKQGSNYRIKYGFNGGSLLNNLHLLQKGELGSTSSESQEFLPTNYLVNSQMNNTLNSQ